MFKDIVNSAKFDETTSPEVMEREALSVLIPMFKQWVSGSHEGAEDALRLLQQKQTRAFRELKPETEKEACLYHLGMLQGTIYSLRELLKAEEADRRLNEELAKQPDEVKNALMALCNSPDDVKHPALANSLGMTQKDLIPVMAELLRIHAAESSRYGKNTTYFPTEAGKRCIAKHTVG